MTQNVVYTQTAKGRAELAASPGKLGPNLRTLLGMIDGKSTINDLQRKLDPVAEDKLRAALDKLAAEGYIETASRPAAVGDKLDFSQPVKQPTHQQRKQAEQLTLAGMRTLKKAGYYVNILSRPDQRLAPRSGDKYTVLIIDSDQAHTLLLARALMLANIDVRSAVSNSEIMAELNKQPLPDAIVMDVILPDVIGLELLGRLRQHPNFSSVPIIVMTSKADQQDVAAALAYGASGYMTKPLKPEAMLDGIKAGLGLV